MQEIIRFINHHSILSAIWVSLLSAILYIVFIRLTSKVKIISNGEVTRLINRENAIVIDIRQNDDFCKGHIACAINISPADIKVDRFHQLYEYKDRPIIVVDDISFRAYEFANNLNKSGFKKIFILQGGILGWNRDNLPLIRSNK